MWRRRRTPETEAWTETAARTKPLVKPSGEVGADLVPSGLRATSAARLGELGFRAGGISTASHTLLKFGYQRSRQSVSLGEDIPRSFLPSQWRQEFLPFPDANR
ncbi:hypothetical protein B0H10DRAFT_1960765 [Mycena sp. CBHHK59/15]|nr:hypothetical protein B0H10DRAFT_1960765 [Mycena sp. CBHHK59/15]